MCAFRGWLRRPLDSLKGPEGSSVNIEIRSESTKILFSRGRLNRHIEDEPLRMLRASDRFVDTCQAMGAGHEDRCISWDDRKLTVIRSKQPKRPSLGCVLTLIKSVRYENRSRKSSKD
jgi:hypothetical protein